jgi:hypothetical protein
MLGRIGRKVSETFHNAVMGVASSRTTKKIVSKATKTMADAVEPGAGVIDKTLQGTKKVVQKATTSDTYKKIGSAIEEGTGKAIKNVITDSATREGSPYKQIGKTHMVAANRSLFGDEMHRRIQGGLDTVAAIAKGHSVANTEFGRMGNAIADKMEGNVANKLALGLPSKMVRGVSNISTGLVTTGGDNLMPMGLKATKLGVGLAATAQLAAGTPQAINQLNSNRQGMNFDSTPVTSAPRTPSYANNGGATGDLVFALNNLRHGGMM